MQDHLKSVGKTIANIELDHPNDPETCTIAFTDGTSLQLSAYSPDICYLFIQFSPNKRPMSR